MKKKIVIDCRMVYHGGIGIFIQNMVKRLLKNNKDSWDFSLLVPKKISNPFQFEENYSTIFFDVPIYSPLEQIAYLKKIPPCDLFWTPHFNAPLLPIRAKKRVVTIHDTYHLSHASSFPFFERLYSKLLYYFALKTADLITTVSCFSQKEIESHFPFVKDKITVIYNGVDHLLFQKPLKKSSYILPDKYFLFVGSLKPHKNLRTLLSAFEIFLKDYPDFSLLIVGKKEKMIHHDPIEAFLFEKPSIKDKVYLYHQVQTADLPFFYSSAFALVFPSLYEGFGLPLLEAMSASCPILASDKASIAEVCQSAAYYFDPLDPRAMAQAMKRLVQTPSLRKELIEKGQMRCKEFSWNRAADALYNLFQKLLNQNQSSTIIPSVDRKGCQK